MKVTLSPEQKVLLATLAESVATGAASMMISMASETAKQAEAVELS